MESLPVATSGVEVGDIRVGGGAPLVVIAGPCVLEDRDRMLRHAEKLRRVVLDAGFPFVFKASFDKANRTRMDAFRGPGLKAGLALLAEIRSTLEVCVLTDVHESAQCSEVSEVVDILQIPAFLCRQTDLLSAAGRTGRPVNIKKGQFVAPWSMGYAVEKVVAAREGAGAPNGVLLTERGTTFGYRDLVVDFRGLAVLRGFAPVVFDATHAVQQPGELGGTTGGARAQVPALVRAAVAVGVDALFLEVHPDPDRAPSDGPTSLDLELLKRVLEEARRIRQVVPRGA